MDLLLLLSDFDPFFWTSVTTASFTVIAYGMLDWLVS